MRRILSVDIFQESLGNTFFRRVLFSGSFCQVVLMTIEPGDDIGEEVHSTTDQFFLFVEGKGEVIVSGEVQRVTKHGAVFVPSGTHHNVRNIGKKNLRLFTLYAPPAHSPRAIQKAKGETEKEMY